MIPQVRKVCKIGNSYHISIPREWLGQVERRTGQFPTEVYIDIGDALVIKPVDKKGN